jgi:outer membrane protein TolC
MRRSCYTLVLLFFAATPAFSQETGESAAKHITLDQAVQIALEKNTNVLTAQYSLEGQQSAVTAAYGNLLPTLSANGSWQRTQAQTQTTYVQGVGDLPIARTSTDNSFRTSLTSSLTLFDGFASTAGVNRATSSAVSAEQTLNRTRQGVVFQVQTLYSNLLRD